MTEEEIREIFRYHSPNPASISAHEAIRAQMAETCVFVTKELPWSRERSLFITLMQQAQMMANAAIAIHGLPKQNDPLK